MTPDGAIYAALSHPGGAHGTPRVYSAPVSEQLVVDHPAASMSASVRTDDATPSNSTVVPGSEVWLTLAVSLPLGTARSASLSSTLSGYDLGVGLGGTAVIDWSVYDVQVPGSGGVTAGGSALSLSLAQSVSTLSVSQAGVVLSLGDVVNPVSGGTGGAGSPVVYSVAGCVMLWQ